MIFTIGDIHGRFDLLKILHKKIMEHSQQYDEIHTVVCLGDYVDRGPQSKEVVDFLSTYPFTGFKHVYLKGNHEDMLIKSIYQENQKVIFDQFVMDLTRAKLLFIKNGGTSTLDSYGIIDSTDLLNNTQIIHDAFEYHREWYTKLKNYYIANGYMFVHAGIIPGLPIEEQDPNVMLWIRDRFLYSDEKHEYFIIHGHTPTVMLGLGTNPEVKSNRINIDTGAHYTGVLTAVCLDEAHIEPPQFINTQYKELMI